MRKPPRNHLGNLYSKIPKGIRKKLKTDKLIKDRRGEQGKKTLTQKFNAIVFGKKHGGKKR